MTPPNQTAPAPAPASPPGARRAFEPDDLYLYKKVTDIAIAPDEQSVACVVRSIERERDTYVSCIWEYGLDGQQVAQLSFGPGLDTSPAWSPDGQTLAFISDRSGANELYLLPRRGGEARQLPPLPGTLQSFRWSVDGRSIIATAALPVDPDDRGNERDDDTPVVRSSNAPEVAWRLPYKADGVGYLLARQIHLFRLDVATGEVVRLTRGDFDVLSFAPSPDSQRVAYVRSREGRFAHASDLWVCSDAGAGHQRITQDHCLVMNPCWSPDGQTLAFAGAVDDGDAELRPWIVDLADQKTRRLCDADVASAPSMRWVTRDVLVFVNAHQGRHRVVKVAADDGAIEVVLDGDCQISAFDRSAHHIAYAVDHPSRPSELHTARADGSDARSLSNLNPWWSERTALTVQSRTFEVPDGLGGTETVHGWLLGAEGEEGALPLLSDFHGGPASYALLDFDSSVYWQVLCSRGWRLLALNAVGSASFGREFCRRLAGHWGSYDFPQHMAAIDQLQREGLCDERIAVAGKSYGGYLTSWAVGHTPRFKAAVVMAPVGNIETHYGTSDGGYYADPYNLGTAPQFDAEKARELSPLQCIDRSSTPTLFLQGKDDERCPKCQSEELFVRMARASDAATELVLYPGEGHGFLGAGAPSCRSDATNRIVRWLEAHVHK